jgi:hypothetical protein
LISRSTVLLVLAHQIARTNTHSQPNPSIRANPPSGPFYTSFSLSLKILVDEITIHRPLIPLHLFQPPFSLDELFLPASQRASASEEQTNESRVERASE